MTFDPGAPFGLLLQSEASGGVEDVGGRQSEVKGGAAGGSDDGGQDGVLSCNPEDTSEAGGGGRRPSPTFRLTFITESNVKGQLGGRVRTESSCDKRQLVILVSCGGSAVSCSPSRRCSSFPSQAVFSGASPTLLLLSCSSVDLHGKRLDIIQNRSQKSGE